MKVDLSRIETGQIRDGARWAEIPAALFRVRTATFDIAEAHPCRTGEFASDEQIMRKLVRAAFKKRTIDGPA